LSSQAFTQERHDQVTAILNGERNDLYHSVALAGPMVKPSSRVGSYFAWYASHEAHDVFYVQSPFGLPRALAANEVVNLRVPPTGVAVFLNQEATNFLDNRAVQKSLETIAGQDLPLVVVSFHLRDKGTRHVWLWTVGSDAERLFRQFLKVQTAAKSIVTQ
jgi:hypothetical protein